MFENLSSPERQQVEDLLEKNVNKLLETGSKELSPMVGADPLVKEIMRAVAVMITTSATATQYILLQKMRERH